MIAASSHGEPALAVALVALILGAIGGALLTHNHG